ncbi:hypothetical protein GSI_11132 [Ganoderma sinense ZZ0214-1]|uniref:Uncharacterized protein n=1 Tax=Ganoderma sinense ZZ0214-1 TaxID=1077348 RepID=A0A2G8RZ46_9APHY|nr:hypothetical protein GSI_11132 [Ganoderma sinense ZZ0214-1]
MEALRLVERPVVRDEGRLSSLSPMLSLPIAAFTTFVLNLPLYFLDVAATNAWGTRAIEYSIGVGCVGTAASLFLCVEKH